MRDLEFVPDVVLGSEWLTKKEASLLPWRVLYLGERAREGASASSAVGVIAPAASIGGSSGDIR